MALALNGHTKRAREMLDRAGALLGQIESVCPAAQSISFSLGGRMCTGQTDRMMVEVQSLVAASREAGPPD